MAGKAFTPKVYVSKHDSFAIMAGEIAPGGMIQFNDGRYIAKTPELVAFLDAKIEEGAPIEAMNHIVHTEGGE